MKLKRFIKSYGLLNLNFNKYLHLGRDTVPAIMEIENVLKDEIHVLRNWLNDTFQEHYLYNLPLFALHSINGYDNRCVCFIIGQS